MIDTRYYHANTEGLMEQGGLFSLDGIHPTAIGQGLIAHEFLKVFRVARPDQRFKEVDWKAIYESDALYQDPIRIMPSLRNSAEGAKMILSLMTALNRVRTVG
jgi:hypothetical protein